MGSVEDAVKVWTSMCDSDRPSKSVFCQEKNISRTTFNRWLKDGRQESVGRPSILSKEDKETLEAMVLRANRNGDSLCARDLKDIILGHETLSLCFKDRKISSSYVQRLLKEINCVERREEVYDPKRHFAERNPLNYENFYEKLVSVYEEFPLLKEEPGRIINIDESPLEGRNTKQLKRKKKVAHKEFLDEQFYARLLNPTITWYPRSVGLKDNNCGHISLLGAVYGDGAPPPPPGFLFSGSVIQQSWFDTEYLSSPKLRDLFMNSYTRATQKGCITQEVFLHYIVKHVIHYARKRFPDGPLLILLDGPDTHQMTVTLAEKLLEYEVIFLYFPANMTCKLQPLDRSVFSEFKTAYRRGKQNLLRVKRCGRAIRLPDNIVGSDLEACDKTWSENERCQGLGIVNQHTEMTIAVAAWKKSSKKKTIKKTFKHTGIVPLDPEKWKREGWCPKLSDRNVVVKNFVSPAFDGRKKSPRGLRLDALEQIKDTLESKERSVSEKLADISAVMKSVTIPQYLDFTKEKKECDGKCKRKRTTIPPEMRESLYTPLLLDKFVLEKRSKGTSSTVVTKDVTMHEDDEDEENRVFEEQKWKTRIEEGWNVDEQQLKRAKKWIEGLKQGKGTQKKRRRGANKENVPPRKRQTNSKKSATRAPKKGKSATNSTPVTVPHIPDNSLPIVPAPPTIQQKKLQPLNIAKLPPPKPVQIHTEICTDNNTNNKNNEDDSEVDTLQHSGTVRNITTTSCGAVSWLQLP